MPQVLTLLCFEQSRLFPEDTAHWALFLRDGNASTGTLFHASKRSLAGRTQYEKVPNIHPAITRSLRASVEVASGLALTDYDLDLQCRAAEQGRPFDLIINNCQRFCTEILQRLVNNGTITQSQFNALAAKGFRPLV